MDEPIRSAFEAVHASELSRQRTKLFVRKKTQDYNSRCIRQSQRRRMLSGLCAAAALLCLCLFYFTPAAMIEMDVNPSIEMKVNRLDRVIQVRGLNADGRELVQNVSLLNLPYNRAVRKLMLSQEMEPFIRSHDLITVSVVGAAPDHTEEMLANVACSALTVAGRENVFYCALSEEDIRQARALDLTVLQYQAFQLLSAQDPSVTADIVRAMDKRELLALLSDFEMDSPCDRAARAK